MSSAAMLRCVARGASCKGVERMSDGNQGMEWWTTVDPQKEPNS